VIVMHQAPDLEDRIDHVTAITSATAASPR